MALDSRVERFLTALAASNPGEMRSATIGERRAGLKSLMSFGGPEIPVARVEDRIIPGAGGPLRIRLYSPTEAATLPALVYFHGGGLVAGTLDTHDPIARALAASGAVRVVSVDYRLAPEYPFPAAVEDAHSAVQYVGDHPEEFGVDPKRLGVCGDSAGATLAAATCQAWAHARRALALQLLICPILDYSRMTASRRALSSGYLIDEATLDNDLKYYLPTGADPANPLVSPLRCDQLTGICRTLIHTAEFDPLRDEGRIYFERLTQARNEVSYTCHPGMIHLFYALGAVIPYARTAFEQIGSEIRAVLA
jgi:acetyl esterase/lipase